jgi:biotin carboxyl carrier protein
MDAAGKTRKPAVTRRPFEFELDGTRRQVVLQREGDRWIAAVDGRELEVSVVEVGGGGRWSLLLGPVGGPAKAGPYDANVGSGSSDANVGSGFSRTSYEVAFEPAPGGGLIVHLNGVAVPVTVLDQPGPPRSRAGRNEASGAEAGGGTANGEKANSVPRTIVAPMPGRIVKVLVTPDEAVAAGQPLVVVEAMKMENELRAPRAGTVVDVRVAEGASVEANTVLVVLR